MSKLLALILLLLSAGSAGAIMILSSPGGGPPPSCTANFSFNGTSSNAAFPSDGNVKFSC